MKMKTSVLAVAVALTASAGAANAALSIPAFGGPGEMFLTVWDDSTGNEASFNYDLGMTMDSFNGANTYSFSNIFADSAFTTNFNASNISTQSNWKWNVTTADVTADNERIVSTAAAVPAAGVITNGSVATAAGSALTYVGNLGGGTSFGTHGTADAGYAGTNYGTNFNAGVAFNDSGSIGQSLAFFEADSTVGPSFWVDSALDPAAVNAFANSWKLDANGTLSYSAAVAPVPVPAAVWLLGSALVGMVGVARRRENQAQDASDAALAV